MSRTPQGKPPHGGLGLLLPGAALVALVAGAGLTACSKSEAAPARRHRAKAESTTVAAGSKADKDAYVAEIIADGSYKAGSEGTVSVLLTPKNGHHTNAQYPYKFKLDAAPAGVTYTKPVLVRADGTFEETKGQFKVPFTAASPGKVTVGGTLFLSVCNDAHCIIEREPLEVQVDVK